MKEHCLSLKVVKIGQELYSKLGPGLLEKCYRNGMVVLFEKAGLSCKTEVEYVVELEGQRIGTYYADLVVEDKIIIECKATKFLMDIHTAQLINYLQISGLEVGYLMNFKKGFLEMSISVQS
jgi:GxxExxY protein